MGLRDTLSHAWSVFSGRNLQEEHKLAFQEVVGYGGVRPDRIRTFTQTERSILAALYTRIAIDVSSTLLQHADLDEHKRFIKERDSKLNRCLNIEANLDQSGREFKQDMVMTLCEKGVIAVLPVETTRSDNESESYDILSLRVGEITAWYPAHVKVNAYDERIGKKREVIVAKRDVAIIENPLYSVMNEPNSTMKRIIRKLNLLDAIDEQSGSGKLDIIIQLPYTVRSDTKREQANKRRSDLESQMKDSKYGIGYIDGSERITQLNRPAENNLLAQIQYLMGMLFEQLGITQSVFDGTADEETMLNYYNRTVEPILAAIADNMRRKFLSKTAITQGQTIRYYNDPFKMVPVGKLAEISDKLTRNAIASPNEIRSIIGWSPVDSEDANKLINRNMPQPAAEVENSNSTEDDNET